MNQVVKDLIEQSTEYMTDTARYSSTVKLPHLNKERLVMLTVDECCKKLEDNGMVEVAMEIKQHFGIL